mgnify:CR=1 FL=1
MTYYKSRINLEVFHVLTDGMGGINFLRELTYQYLRLVHPELAEKEGNKLSGDTSSQTGRTALSAITAAASQADLIKKKHI